MIIGPPVLANGDAQLAGDALGPHHSFLWERREGKTQLANQLAALIGVEPDAPLSVSDFASLIHPDDLHQVTEGFCRSMRSGAAFDVVLRLRRDPAEMPLWLNVRGDFLRDGDGAHQAVKGMVTDISQWRLQDSPIIGLDMQPDTRICEQDLLNCLPQMVWSARADGVTDFYSQRWYDFTGVPVGSTDGDRWSDVLHPDDADLAAAQWALCVQQGQDYEIEYRIRKHTGEYAWVLARAVLARDTAERPLRWYGTCTDIDDRKTAESRRDLIADELAHRIKNVFTVVNSLIALSTDRDTQTIVSAALTGRVAALAGAYRHVMPAETAAGAGSAGTVQGLMHDLLLPYNQNDETRVVIEGDDFPVARGTATALALLFHELATNGVKYGSLGVSGGRVTIEIRIDGDQIDMIWRESGGQGVTDPGTECGFGTNLVDRVARMLLNATIERTWHPDGLAVRVSMPIKRLQG